MSLSSDEIERQIDCINQRLTMTADDHPTMQLALAQLGALHVAQFPHLGELDDLQKAIEYTSIALTLIHEDSPDMPHLLDTLARSYGHRFEHLREGNDAAQAVEYASLALSITPDRDPELPLRLYTLGAALRDHYTHLGSLDDLDEAINYQNRSLALTPYVHPYLELQLANLGMSHTQRFKHLGQLNDLEKALEYGYRLVALTPLNHSQLPDRYAYLGKSHRDRFERLGDQDDLMKALALRVRSLELIAEANPKSPGRLDELGLAYFSLYERLGNMPALDKAIGHQSHALDMTPNDHPDLPSRLGNLGMFHRARFTYLGELDEVEKAVEYESRALALTPNGHPSFPRRLGSLGTSHGYRFQVLGEMGDIEKAIKYLSQAVDLTPHSHPDRPAMLSMLGGAHGSRHKFLDELGDLEKVIECNSAALELMPDNHPSFSKQLHNLAVSHSIRYRQFGEQADFEKAITYGNRALVLDSGNPVDLSFHLGTLAMSHTFRFERLGELEDLRKATDYHCHAIALTPEEYNGLNVDHYNLANNYFSYFQCTNDLCYLRLSLESFRKASQLSSRQPRDQFSFAYRWATLASQHSALIPIEAYQTAIDLLPQFVWLGATTSQRYQDLSTAEALAVKAASAAIVDSKPALALEWLEHARCVVWNQSLMLRSSFNEFQTVYPALGARLQIITHQLHNVSTESREPRSISFGSMIPEQTGQWHRRLAREYSDLLSHVRTLPGFEDFLLPVKAEHLVRVARNGPIVVINCDQDRCDALVILPTQTSISHIPLPGFTGQKAKQARSEIEASLRRKGLRERGVKVRQDPGHKDGMGSALAMLWYSLMRPILEFLGYINRGTIDTIPHVTWCPTGPLSFLPLHAAGDYDQPGSRVFDYVISSYTPNLTALLSSTSSTLDHDGRVLAIGQAATPGRSSLPGTAKELAYVKAHIQDKAGYSQLIDDQATTSAVLDAMGLHNWVHLACHAHQNVTDPTKSGFFLHNGTLDLATINRRSFKKKGLAFLSACQTATGDEKLPDEAIHLASGMLMAGYSSVIATMWSVIDYDAPLVADQVYGQLMKVGKVGNGEAGAALHHAAAELCKKVGEKAFERWVPYIHIGS